MLNFRSVFKCKAPCHCHSRASGTSHSPQRGRSLTANLTWNCSLTEGLSLFYRWRLGLNFFSLALWHPGSWWFREWDWSPVSAICLSANVKGKISFCLAEMLVTNQMKNRPWICYVEKGRTRKSVMSCPSTPLRPHASCYTMKGPCPALPPSTLWNLTNHISTKNHGPFGSLHPQSLQNIDEAILLYLVAFKIYRHTWARSDRKNNLILAATTEKSNYYLGRSVSPSFKTKLYFITRLHQPH